jgi:hypothetical protein
MSRRGILRKTAAITAAAAAAGAGVYGAWAAIAWRGYGHPSPAGDGDSDPLLDTFMPRYDVVERHHVRVAAPADVTFAAACEQELGSAPIVRAIFRTRRLVMGAPLDDDPQRPRGILAETRALGWGTLAERPGREIVMGGVTRPWEASPVFRALSPETFAAFDEPDFVKIAWTLRADPSPSGGSTFYTETRAVATDAGARQKFRRYWAFASPGIWMIRRTLLGPLKADAERRAVVHT